MTDIEERILENQRIILDYIRNEYLLRYGKNAVCLRLVQRAIDKTDEVVSYD